ncbi:MAG: damage-inducible protein DinB [Marinosulfonomonas sp.]|nr:MAG: damage-inducible protein DinB [Marinosulfonomonas sp.]
MINADYCQTMARYNRWQNRSLYREADGISESERQLDRGAFFGSIQQTLSHILWGDTMWMSRFDGWTPPDVQISEKGRFTVNWDDLKAMRYEADAKIADWAGRISDDELGSDFSWQSSFEKTDMIHPYGLLVVHVFNHQTHHRGQVHAMLTAAGAKPDPTDLPFMPDEF